jgi:hypothetical protein
MSEEIENKINKIPIVKQLVFFAKAIKLKIFRRNVSI